MRMELNHPDVTSFDNVLQLGVILSHDSVHDQNHVGFLYKMDDEPACILHLRWHMELKNEEPTSDFFWLQSPFDEIERKVIAPALARVAENQKLPISYSTIFEGIYFEKGNLEYKRDTPGDGLTCATFVLAIMETLGYPVLLRDTWRERDADKTWTQRIIGVLKAWAARKGIDISAHVEAIQSRPSGIRFRPEEVAAGMADPRAPLDFSTAQKIGQDLIGQIQNFS